MAQINDLTQASFDACYVEHISACTGWTEDIVKHKLTESMKLHIQPSDYIRFQCWELDEDGLLEVSSVVQQLQQSLQKEIAWNAKAVKNRTIYSQSRLRRMMAEYSAAGITPIMFVERGLYYPFRSLLPCKTLKKQMYWLRHPEKRKVVIPKHNRYFDKIREVTGWKGSKVELEVSKAYLRCGAIHENYFLYKMYELTPDEQRGYITRRHFHMMANVYNRYLITKLLDDKSLFNFIFAKHIKRRWFINRNLSYRQFLKKIDGLDTILVKSTTGTRGKEVQKLQCNVEDKRALYQKIISMPPSVIEEYIKQHDAVNAMCSTSVNTVRITTLNVKGECKVLYAVFRMGQGSVVDNLHNGGIIAAIDIETGVVITDALDMEGNTHAENAYSGMKVKGFQIPHWDKILDACKACYRRIPGVNFIGWDFAITPDGVDLIEGNSMPSSAGIQLTYSSLKKGLYSTIIEPYLEEL